jgi:predicted ATPase/class 3 adenylate cyclase
MAELPSGTVTFLFTDLEVSTRLWDQEPEAMRSALARHDLILREAVAKNGGHVVKGTGDGIHAVFATTDSAISAAIEVQVAMSAEQWAVSEPLRVRIGIHTGVAEFREGDYFGSSVNRAARLMGVAHGGQVVCSQAAADLVRESMPKDVSLADMGEHRLRDLSRAERVFQVIAPGLHGEFPPLRSLDVARTNLPVQLTSFVGREEDVKSVGALVGEHRVVTVTGVGGVGKTRLALQVAAEALDVFPEGVWVVELSPLGEASRLVEALAAVLSVEPSPGRTIEQALVDKVKASAVLVVLDNCEHLLGETGRVVGVLVRAAPRLAVLATSREPLGVAGERVVALRSLESESAVRLFAERAVAVDSSFALGDSEGELVAHLCRRLNGIPLAIELAAARVRMFSPAELVERLDARFRLLTGGRGAVERHQTLRAAIDWSYDVLAARDRAVFDRMSVFAGGSTLAAAEAVCAGDRVDESEVVDSLASLIDKSLVVPERSELGTRYRQSETVRQYAEEQLLGSGEADAVRERHAHYFAVFASDAGRGLWSSEEVHWAQRVEADLDNVRAAVSWAVAAGETDLAMRIAGALVTQAVERPAWATASIAEQALSGPGADAHPWRAIATGEAAWAAQRRGDTDRARVLLEDAIEAQRHGARFTAPVWTYAAMLSDPDWWSSIAVERAEEALARAEAAGDVAGTVALRAARAATLIGLSGTDRADEARASAERALTDARALGQPALIAMGLLAFGAALVFTGEVERGLTMVRESRQLSTEINSTWQSLNALAYLTGIEAIYGDPRRAATDMRELLESFQDSDDSSGLTALHGTLAVFNRWGRPDLVARAEGHLTSLGGTWGGYVAWYDRAIAEARAMLGDQQYDALAAQGADIPWHAFTSETIANLSEFLDEAEPDPQP